MKSFEGKLAVVTGGGSGIGRELVAQLSDAGCSVATCDLNVATVRETAARAQAVARKQTRVTSHVCDVADEKSVNRFRDEVITQHQTDHINLLFNNAGVFRGVSFVSDDRVVWDRVFGILWGGVYNCCRAFVPLLVSSTDGLLVNLSSIQGFWVDGPGYPNTAYGTAKFAVKGFSESLIEDFRFNAPHVKVALVMPGQIRTELGPNSASIVGVTRGTFERDRIRAGMVGWGIPLGDGSDEDWQRMMDAVRQLSDEFLTTSPQVAATTILDGIRTGRWRILVGEDAYRLDEAVRAHPDRAYEVETDLPVRYKGWFIPLAILLGLFDPDGAPNLNATYEIRDGTERITIRAADGSVEISRREAAEADALIQTDPPTFWALLTSTETMIGAIRRGALKVSGDRRKVERLFQTVAIPQRSASSTE